MMVCNGSGIKDAFSHLAMFPVIHTQRYTVALIVTKACLFTSLNADAFHNSFAAFFSILHCLIVEGHGAFTQPVRARTTFALSISSHLSIFTLSLRSHWLKSHSHPVHSYVIMYILWLFMYAVRTHDALFVLGSFFLLLVSICAWALRCDIQRRQYRISPWSVRKMFEWKLYLCIAADLVFPFMSPVFSFTHHSPAFFCVDTHESMR